MINLKYVPLFAVLFVVAYLALLSLMNQKNEIKPEGARQLADCPDKPNCISSLSSTEGHAVQAFTIQDGQAAEGWNKLIAAIVQSGGEILINDGRYSHAVFSSRLFRFKDDFEAVLGEDKIDVRSASRAGRSDFGMNRKRIENIRTRYTAMP